MVFRLPCMTIIFSEKKHISPVLHSFCLGWRRVRSVTTISRLKGFKSNHFGKERRDGKRTLAKKNFPSSPSCPLSPSFALQTGFTQEQFPTITFFPEKEPERNLPNLELSDECSERQSSAFCLRSVFGGKSQWCVMMIAVRGKFCPKLIY